MKSEMQLTLYETCAVPTKPKVLECRGKTKRKIQDKELERRDVCGFRDYGRYRGNFHFPAKYIQDILERFHMTNAAGETSPMADTKNISEDDNKQPTYAPYREAIGSLLYVENRTRPDVLFSVNYLARFNNCPTEYLWRAVKQIFRYLKQTIDFGIRFNKQDKSIRAYCDADWASERYYRYSMSGAMFGGRPIFFLA